MYKRQIITVSDLSAIGVLNEAENLGIQIGQELAVIGFDDVPLVQYLRPALTTLRQPIPEIAQALMTMLQAIISEETPPAHHILLPPRLIKRASA